MLADYYDTTFDAEDSKFTDNQFKRDSVTRTYRETDKKLYPHLQLSCRTIERFRVEALKGILIGTSGFKPVSVDDSERFLSVYINLNGSEMLIGELRRSNLKALLTNSVFGKFGKRIYLAPDDYIEGDMLFAFCEIGV